MTGISAYAAYLPHWRLMRSDIGSFLGSGSGNGSRAVAGFDEDTTSLGVEAARRALAVGDATPDVVYFATTRPAYAEKSNATVIHAALGLEAAVPAFDAVGTARSAAGAITAGLDAAATGRRALVVLSDIRGGRPGSTDERDGGDGAVALLLGGGSDELATLVGRASRSAEFLDAWRLPEEVTVSHWEERFSEAAYLPLLKDAVTAALADAGLVAEDIAHAVVSGPSQRIVKKAGAAVPGDVAIAERLLATVGNLGTAHGPLGLAAALDVAAPGEVIALVSLADGVDVTLWRATERVARSRPEGLDAIAERLAGGATVDYGSFLTWRGTLQRETPRRPDPDRPAAPPSLRSADWKFAVVAARCESCGTRQLPPQRICTICRAVDRWTPERVADVRATVRTFAVDRLAYTIAPPLVSAVVDFDGGGRLQCELTDLDPQALRVGDRVELTFRRTHSARNVHNYFWKARPLTGGREEAR